MKYILLILVLALVSCQDTNSNSLDELSYGQPELDLSGGGGDGGDGGGGAPPTSFQLAMSVVTPKCVGCHTSYHASWAAYSTEQDWINAGGGLVVSGDADGSDLVDRLQVWGTGGPGPDTMPVSGSALTATEYGYISDWINSL